MDHRSDSASHPAEPPDTAATTPPTGKPLARNRRRPALAAPLAIAFGALLGAGLAIGAAKVPVLVRFDQQLHDRWLASRPVMRPFAAIRIALVGSAVGDDATATGTLVAELARCAVKRGALVVVDDVSPIATAITPSNRCVVAASAAAPAPPIQVWGDPPAVHAIASTTSPEAAPLRRPRQGVPDLPADADGVLRRIPLVWRDGRHIVPGLVLAAAMARFHETSLQFTDQGRMLRSFGRVDLPLDGHGALLLRFRGPPGTFPTRWIHTSAEVTSACAELNKGQVLVIGSSTTVTTPLGPGMERAEVLATALDNLDRADPLREPALPASVLWSTTIGVLVALTVRRRSAPWIGLVCVALAGAATWGIARWRYADEAFAIAPAPLTAAAVVLAVWICSPRPLSAP